MFKESKKIFEVFMLIIVSIILSSIITSCRKKNYQGIGEGYVVTENDNNADYQGVGEQYVATSSDDEFDNTIFGTTEESPASDFTYELTESGDGVKIGKYKGTDEHVVIPSEIEGMTVTELGDNTFDKSNVVIVEMPDTITKVGNDTFGSCKLLTNVKLSKSLKNISTAMFILCKSLTNLKLPETITSIENGAFSMSGIVSISIPNSAKFEYEYQNSHNETEIFTSDCVFSDCKDLKYVKLPTSMSSIPEGTFSRCVSLCEISLPKNIVKIEEQAFEQCVLLENIVLPESLTEIGTGAFRDSGLKSLSIPENVTKIGDYAFCDCKIEYLRLPNHLTEIDSLFYNDLTLSNRYLKSANLPSSLTEMGNTTFYNSKDLQELIIPDTLTSIKFIPTADFYETTDTFYNTALPLSTQKRLKELGYKGKFTE